MSELFSGFEIGEIRAFPGAGQTVIANGALTWCRQRHLNWKIKTWHHENTTYAMRIDDLPDSVVKAKIDAFPGPSPERGIGRALDRMIVNKYKLHSGAAALGFKHSPRDTSKYRWAEMDVGDKRLVSMTRVDAHYFLSRFLLGHPDIDWEFCCTRERSLEALQKCKQMWVVERTR